MPNQRFVKEKYVGTMHPKINLLGFAPVLVPMPVLVLVLMLVPVPVPMLVPMPCLDKILFADFSDVFDLGQSGANINDL